MNERTPPNSWMHLLRQRCTEAPQQVPYTMLVDGERQATSLTHAQLDRQARAIAAKLQQGETEGRALLLYPPGLDFIAGLFGCWYAGITAVPAYPPRSAQHSAAMTTLATIAKDAQPSAVLTVSRLAPTIAGAGLASCSILATDELTEECAAAWREPLVHSEMLACLQYTSGSTTAPKGVMLTHGHLLNNSATIRDCFGHSPGNSGVIWLPPYHDMGLIGGILQALFVGGHVTLMSPASFLQKPLRWLAAISTYGATTSGGPGFAYDLCVDRIGPEDKKSLDLSRWDVAFIGAEPIHPQTLDRFAQAFAPCGFRPEAFYPCYGLAEATLFVAGGDKSAPPVLKRTHSGKTLVGSGCPRPIGSVLIVDPETRTQCPESCEGEIWIRRSAAPQAYWNKPAETEETFNACLSDSGQGPFLRTGDLGLLDGGELFITGRLKDLIIIRGVNHYPQDIEQTVQASHAALRAGCGAAFSVDGDGHERLVIAQEVHRTERDAPAAPLIDAIRKAVTEQHEVEVSAIALLKPGQILKTSSGKVRRSASRQALLEGRLQTMARWEQAPEPPPAPPPLERPRTFEQIQATLIQMLARAVNVPADQIDPAEAFARHGVDSAGAASLAADLSQIMARQITVMTFYDYPSVRELARHLASQQETSP